MQRKLGFGGNFIRNFSNVIYVSAGDFLKEASHVHYVTEWKSVTHSRVVNAFHSTLFTTRKRRKKERRGWLGDWEVMDVYKQRKD